MKKEQLEELRKKYPKGTRVMLIRMDDAQAPKPGTKGTVKGVDDIGSILMVWDSGGSLNLIPGQDEFTILKTVKTICYHQEKVWDSREEAIDFFEEGIIMSEGSERERYQNIVTKLKLGYDECSDSE